MLHVGQKRGLIYKMSYKKFVQNLSYLSPTKRKCTFGSCANSQGQDMTSLSASKIILYYRKFKLRENGRIRLLRMCRMMWIRTIGLMLEGAFSFDAAHLTLLFISALQNKKRFFLCKYIERPRRGTNICYFIFGLAYLLPVIYASKLREGFVGCLNFNGPINTIKVMSIRPVHLTTPVPGRFSPLNG